MCMTTFRQKRAVRSWLVRERALPARPNTRAVSECGFVRVRGYESTAVQSFLSMDILDSSVIEKVIAECERDLNMVRQCYHEEYPRPRPLAHTRRHIVDTGWLVSITSRLGLASVSSRDDPSCVVGQEPRGPWFSEPLGVRHLLATHDREPHPHMRLSLLLDITNKVSFDRWT